MATVGSIIKDVFGNPTAAANALGVKRSAVSNWKAWGYFPARLVGPIWKRARDRGLEIGIDDIPATPEKKPDASKLEAGPAP